jgi:hypothetical protein
MPIPGSIFANRHGDKLCCFNNLQEKHMKANTILAVGALVWAALYTPLAAAQAAQFSWMETKRPPTVYQAGTDNSVFFSAPSTVTVPLLPPNNVVTISSSAVITGVSWNIMPYTNGSPTQTFQICYAPPYTSAYNRCTDVTNTLTVNNSSFFNGQLVKGSQFRITGNISGGGSFPAIPGANQNFTIQVNFSQ